MAPLVWTRGRHNLNPAKKLQVQESLDPLEGKRSNET
jgi:hypothetical protein